MKKWLRYKFDMTMSRGVVGLILWLFVFCAVLAIVTAVFAILVRPKDTFALTWWLDFQTTTGLTIGQGEWHKVLSAFLPRLGNMFMGGLLTGLIITSIQGKLRNLRKGRSEVVESDHQVILGWSDAVFTVIQELCLANESRKSPTIVVLAPKDKVEMEDAIRAKVPKTGPTRIICRTGDPIDPSDLHLTSPRTARSFIVLAPDGDDPDSQVIKTMLALTNNPEVDPRTVVAEMRDPKKIAAARLISRDSVRLLSMDDLIARITVQACRQAGMSLIYSELLTFEGDEMYLHEEPSLVGKSFGDALLAYDTSSVVGIVRDRQTRFNPAMDDKLVAGDRLVVISADATSIATGGRGRAAIEHGKIVEGTHQRERHPIHALFLGWNRRGAGTVQHLDEQVAGGSEITVVADFDDGEARLARECPNLKHAKLAYRKADITDGDVLEKLGVEKYDHIVTLGYSDRLTAHQADAQTLITLIFLRDIRRRVGEPFSIVTEMLEPQNRKLAEVAHADDFIVSTELVSDMLAQMSENPDLTYNELFEAEGSEIDLRPVTGYVQIGESVTFATVVEAARRRGECAVGYRIAADSASPAKRFGIRVNPPKSSARTFASEDKIIVIALN